MKETAYCRPLVARQSLSQTNMLIAGFHFFLFFSFHIKKNSFVLQLPHLQKISLSCPLSHLLFPPFPSSPFSLFPPPSCDHYSNFGLLFSSCSSEDWTIWRILTLSLFGFMWCILLILWALVVFSKKFRRASGTETAVEKKNRVLGQKTTLQKTKSQKKGMSWFL